MGADTPPFSILILHSVRNTELHLHLKNINNTAKMVADSLIYHPSVAHYLKYVATTVGRDKLLRTIQYFSRFYAWYLYRTNGTPGEIAPFDAIKKQFGPTQVDACGQERRALQSGSYRGRFQELGSRYQVLRCWTTIGICWILVFGCCHILGCCGHQEESYDPEAG